MFDQLVDLITSFFYRYSPLLILGVLVVPLWWSWSHKGEFALSWKDKLLRPAMLFILIIAGFALASVLANRTNPSSSPNSPVTWDPNDVD